MPPAPGGAAPERVPQDLVDRAREVSLLHVIGSTVRLKKAGREYVGICPFHKEKTPSFTVVEAKGFYHCFGCGAHGDPISWKMQVERLTFRDAVMSLTNCSLPTRTREASSAFLEGFKAAAAQYAADGFRRIDEDERAKLTRARAIWASAQPARGTMGEGYLRSRAITRRSIHEVFRFVPALYCSEADRRLPAVVAPVHDSRGEIVAVHRIWLDPATGRRAPVKKKTLGLAHDGAIRLRPASGDLLGLAEGPETGCSAVELFLCPVWVTLGQERYARVWIPPNVRTLYLFADGAGEDQEAKRLKTMAHAIEATERWEAQGLEVVIQAPPEGAKDWNEHHQRTAQ